MARLIDADALLDSIRGLMLDVQGGQYVWSSDVLDCVINAPTVEAVEIGPLAEWLARTSPAGSAFVRVGAELERCREDWEQRLTEAAKELNHE